MKSNKKNVFESKNPVFGSKSSEKFRNFGKFVTFGKSLEKVWKFGNSELSENYKKMTFNLKFENLEKLVLTRKSTRKFGLKFWMQGLIYHVNIEFLFSQNYLSDSNSDFNILVWVRYAEPAIRRRQKTRATCTATCV